MTHGPFQAIPMRQSKIPHTMTKPSAPALNSLRKSLLLTAASIFLACPTLLAQTTPATPTPSFDAATIKPHKPDPMPVGLGYVGNTPDGIKGVDVTVISLVMYAYGVPVDTRVVGGPEWAKSERYDVEAKMSAEDIAAMKALSPAEKQAHSQEMMLTLLAERFQLKAHSETRQNPIYELVVAKGGAKIRDASNDTTPLQTGRDGKSFSGLRETSATTSVAQNYSLKSFADYLSIPAFGIGRPVVDKTGLTGTYNFTLNWSIYARSARPAPETGASDPADEGSFLTTALKEIGLDLRPAMGGVEYIVIDHVEHPTAN
jgi:uncharacterized protein (TIGR03435 family)